MADNDVSPPQEIRELIESAYLLGWAVGIDRYHPANRPGITLAERVRTVLTPLDEWLARDHNASTLDPMRRTSDAASATQRDSTGA